MLFRSRAFPFVPGSTYRRRSLWMRWICVWCCLIFWKMHLKPAFALHPPGGRLRSPRMSMPSGFFWSKWKTHLTAQFTKKAGCSALPREGKTGSASSLSAILQKRPAGQARLPIRTAFSQPKLCSADKEPFALAGLFMPEFLQKIHAGRVAAAYRMCYDEVQNFKRSDGF